MTNSISTTVVVIMLHDNQCCYDVMVYGKIS